jgi:CBS domain-containing protein
MNGKTAEDIMNKKVITITKDKSVLYLEELLIKNKISGVPVVDDDNKVIGIITRNDFIRSIVESKGSK